MSDYRYVGLSICRTIDRDPQIHASKKFKINLDLKYICKWLKANKISLNASKNKVLIFRHQNKPVMYRKNLEDKLSMWNNTIKIDGKKIEPSTHVKYLGIFIDSFLNWNFQIDELSTKLFCAVGMLAKIRHYINTKILFMVYHGIFSSLLLYGSQIWGQSNQSVSKMEKLQNKALRIINFKPLRYSVNSLYNKCEILKFGDSIKLPTTLCAGITLLDSEHSQITRNQKGNQVNIPTVSSVSNGTNSKSVNT